MPRLGIAVHPDDDDSESPSTSPITSRRNSVVSKGSLGDRCPIPPSPASSGRQVRQTTLDGGGEWSSPSSSNLGGSHGRMLRAHNRTAMRQTVIGNLKEQQRLELEMFRAMNKTTSVWHKVPRIVVDSYVFVTLTGVLTLYALSGDDFRLMLTDKPADIYFDLLTVLCLLVFTVEIVCSCFAKRDYIGGFFFWLDLVSTTTLVLDITAVNEALLAANEDDQDQVANMRARRLGARLARVVRVLRLLRLLKLYKAALEHHRHLMKQRRAEKKRNSISKRRDEYGLEDEEDMEHDDIEDLAKEASTELTVGKKLSDLTTRRCVIIILTMMLCHPLIVPPKDQLPRSEPYAADLALEAFNRMQRQGNLTWLYHEAMLRLVYYHNWYSHSSAQCTQSATCPGDHDAGLFWLGLAGLDPMELVAKASNASIDAAAVENWEQKAQQGTFWSTGSFPPAAQRILASSWNHYCPTKGKKLHRYGLSLLAPGLVDYEVACPEDLRRMERQLQVATLVSKKETTQWHFVFYFDKRRQVRNDAAGNIMTTVFIMVLLVGAAAMFASDSETLVLKPLEIMMLKVHMIRMNPLVAATLADDAMRKQDLTEKRRQEWAKQSTWKKLKRCLMCTSESHDRTPNETAVLERTLVKLGMLLALGFGTAGMDIISNNMKEQDSVSINAMVDGTTVECFLCHVQVADFWELADALQEGALTLVTQLAEIVHGVAISWFGAPSRNNGDTFLVVWTVDADGSEGTTKMADMALSAACYMLAGVHRCGRLAKYRHHSRVIQRLGTGCRISLTCGLHYGWAIQGAIGSEYKIEAAHVSPNVNIAASVGAAAEAYGTSVIMTDAVHKALSKDLAVQCRLVDTVKTPGSSAPIQLRTLDLNYMLVEVEEELSINFKFNTRTRLKLRRLFEQQKLRHLNQNTASNFYYDPDVRAMREPYTVHFKEVFNMGYQNYVAGEWHTAKRCLEHALEILGYDDGPTVTLLQYMERSSDFQAPENWKGYHPLEDIMQCAPSRRYIEQELAKAVYLLQAESRPTTTSVRSTVGRFSVHNLKLAGFFPKQNFDDDSGFESDDSSTPSFEDEDRQEFVMQARKSLSGTAGLAMLGNAGFSDPSANALLTDLQRHLAKGAAWAKQMSRDCELSLLDLQESVLLTQERGLVKNLQFEITPPRKVLARSVTQPLGRRESSRAIGKAGHARCRTVSMVFGREDSKASGTPTASVRGSITEPAVRFPARSPAPPVVELPAARLRNREEDAESELEVLETGRSATSSFGSQPTLT
eukprot:TRINITY_DN49450_c0_g1_i1.p1 TRINITY_DN49450_c0_g1~~TRINITY_DN49450_c0_g1_i1.p1  ORF type:complete len:1273 (-),score=200.64 TRINITY_DN49450_c0_g1_i1:135-3953(-)